MHSPDRTTSARPRMIDLYDASAAHQRLQFAGTKQSRKGAATVGDGPKFGNVDSVNGRLMNIHWTAHEQPAQTADST